MTEPMDRSPSDFAPLLLPARHNASLLNSDDLFLFNEGTHNRMYEKLGAHLGVVDGESGTFLGVWAPSARQVTAIGDVNGWNPGSHPLSILSRSGLQPGF